MRFRTGVLFAAGLTLWGCGPPEIVPMTPPGVSAPRVVNEDEEAQAIGERKAQGAIAPPTPPPASKSDTAKPQ